MSNFFFQASSSARDAAKRFTPLFGRVLIQRLQPQAVSVGGIKLPESAQPKQNVGVVLSVSEGVSSVKVNDEVLLSEYAGTELKLENEDFLLYRDEDLLGVFRK